MTERDKFGREPATTVCIKQDFCSRSCGVAPCTAAEPQKCFNTRATCQDPDNFDLDVLPLNFIDAKAGRPIDKYYIPSVDSVRVSAAELNPGGVNKSSNPLGRRSTVTVTFQDHPHDDKLVDPYRDERDYDPNERATFWTKWRARNPYFMHRVIEIESGYVADGVLVDAVKRVFVITGFKGPTAAGVVTIEGKDVLTLAENDKAKAPAASSGKLMADLTDSASTATLVPAGVGDLIYPASGKLRINKELVEFTRSGDTLTLTTRGARGTDAKAHKLGDSVQVVLTYTSEKPHDILYDLMVNYAGIPAEYIDATQWDAEQADYLPRLYSADIAAPEGTSKLISEICEQMYLSILWDERDAKIRIQALRPPVEEEVIELDDDQHLIKNSVKWEDATGSLITQVWIHYGQVNPIEKLDDPGNYAALEIVGDFEGETRPLHDMSRVKEVFSRWITAANTIAATDLGTNILARYSEVPRVCSFSLDAKDRDLWLGDFIRVTNRNNVDIYGQMKRTDLQVTRAVEDKRGSQFSYVAQEYITATLPTIEGDITFPIAAHMYNVNLRTLYESSGGTPTGDETIIFVIRTGVEIGGDTAGGGENVLPGARVSTNDYYAGGVNAVNGSDVIGQVNILQRKGLASPTTWNAGDTYETGRTAAYKIEELPTSVALRTGTWPAGTKLKLIVETGARILGEGGNGGAHAFVERKNGGVSWQWSRLHYAPNGGDGGDALLIEHDIEIHNLGVISRGSGGGAGATYIGSAGDYHIVPGGGGAGARPGHVSAIAGSLSANRMEPKIGGDVDYGEFSYEAGGAGGSASYVIYGTQITSRYNGGNGGALNNFGYGASATEEARQPNYSLVYSDYIDAGGQPGDAVRAGANMITWINKGDLRGVENG